MPGTDNLTPFSHESAAEHGAAGGKKSGEARRKKANLRKAVQQALESSYSLPDGTEGTGETLIVSGLIRAASNPESKGYAAAVRTICDLTGAMKDDLDRKEQRARIKKLQDEKNEETEKDHVTIYIPNNGRIET